MLHLLFNLCSDKNQFVFQVSGMFGNTLTVEELEYWLCYNIIERAKFHDVDYQALPMDVVIELTEKEEKKRKAKHK